MIYACCEVFAAKSSMLATKCPIPLLLSLGPIGQQLMWLVLFAVLLVVWFLMVFKRVHALHCEK